MLKEDEAVYLTKNGYGSMVVLSLEKYEIRYLPTFISQFNSYKR